MHLAGQIRLLGAARSVPTVPVLSTHQAPGLPGCTTQDELEGIPVFSCYWPNPQGLSLGSWGAEVSRWLLTLLPCPREQQQLQNLADKDWHEGPGDDANLKIKSYNFTTLYPYGDPEMLDYDTVSPATFPRVGDPWGAMLCLLGLCLY